MRIGNWDSESGHTFVIAEIGTNHEGDLERAKRLISQAALAGADCAKFQVYDPDRLVDPNMPPMSHAATETTQLERMRKRQFTHDQYRQLARVAEECGIMWSASAWDKESVDLVAELSPMIKIGSGEAANIELIEYARQTGRSLVISTGMLNPDEDTLADDEEWIAHLYCLSLYPTPLDKLGFISELFIAWDDRPLYDGYSDHTIGDEACLAAVAMGAQIIEKHFTDVPYRIRMDMAGDHQISLDRAELTAMTAHIAKIELMKRPWKGERPDRINIPNLRRDPVTGLRMGPR